MRMSNRGISLALSMSLIGLASVLGAVSLATLSGVSAVSDDTLDMRVLLDLILDPGTSEFESNPILAAAVVYTPYFADFEGGDLDGFTFDNSFGDGNGLWHLSTACASLEDSGLHSAFGSLYYGIDATCNYDTGTTKGMALSPMIDLTGVVAPITLSFNYHLETENSGTRTDGAFVQVSTNGGAFSTVAINNRSGTVVLSDPSDGWTSAIIDLSASSGGVVQFRFGFGTGNSYGNDFDGFNVDDVFVIGTPATFTINVPTLTIDIGTTFRFTTTSNDPDDVTAWMSSNPAVASVDPLTGLVTGLSAGTVIITATASNSGLVDTVVVIVNPLLDATATSGAASGGGGCFVATAAFGTPLADEIDVLRTLRDTYFLESAAGALFVDMYYRMSPPLADAVAQYPLLASLTRVVLAPVIALARLIVMTPVAHIIGAIVPFLLLLSGAIRVRHRRASLTARYR